MLIFKISSPLKKIIDFNMIFKRITFQYSSTVQYSSSFFDI